MAPDPPEPQPDQRNSAPAETERTTHLRQVYSQRSSARLLLQALKFELWTGWC